MEQRSLTKCKVESVEGSAEKLTGTFLPSSQNVIDSQEDLYTPISQGILKKKTKRKGDADTSPNADSESLNDKDS